MAAAPKRRRVGKVEIATDLRNQIVRGDLGEGDQLPTEAALIDRYGTSRNTVREGLAILVGEGLVVAKRPHGYFVRDGHRMEYRPQSDLTVRPDDVPKDVFLTELADAGRTPTQTIDVAIVRPPADVAARLGLSDDEHAVVRRRVRFLEGAPYMTNDSYFPLTLAQGTAIMSPEDIARGANRVLADAGHVQVRAVDEFTIRMPTPDEQHRLALGPGTPVARQFTTGYDRHGKALRVAITILPGDRHTIVIDRPGLPDPEAEPS
ncbi:GntR family transcriptional regulator [Myceligenerans pegani]|uniref:GntR family transcriptional regulator n=1 Tax=Myceligenerans pegani TaxID=2776917 RepID=UPI00299F1144|nr:GntR family transcriptional regulator [Myceligenerans sp. TRM 65318]